MIKLICGEKGAGKTKKILDMANDTAQTSKGSVVFLDKDDSHKLGLSYKVRLNDMSEWRVSSDNELVAFIKGMLATNYDITDIFVDSSLKICCGDVDAFAAILPQLEAITADVNLVMTVSIAVETCPDTIKAYT